MAYITKFGTLHGSEILATGRHFFVAPSSPYVVDGRSYDASDDNDGESPERALATVSRAVTLAGISRGGATVSNGKDTIVLLPGTHTLTALLRLQNAGLTITGLPNSVKMEGPYPIHTDTLVVSTGTSQHSISIEASNITLANFTLRPTSGFIGVIFRNNPTVDNLRFKNFVVDLHSQAVSINTGGIDFGYRADSATALHGSWSTKGNAAAATIATAYLEGVTVLARDGQGRGIEQATASLNLKNVWFKHTGAGTWATPYHVATNSVNSFAESLRFTTSGTMSTNMCGANATATNAIVVNKTLFSATTTDGSPMSRFASNVCRASECFQPDRRHTLGFMVSVVSTTGDGN